MTLVVEPPPVSAQERAWRDGEAVATTVMGTVNQAIARLVSAVQDLLATDGWGGVGIRSPEQWVCWKAGVSSGRARGLVRIARRAGELPACFALFRQGRLGEDAMVRIARKVPLLTRRRDRRPRPEPADLAARPRAGRIARPARRNSRAPRARAHAAGARHQ